MTAEKELRPASKVTVETLSRQIRKKTIIAPIAFNPQKKQRLLTENRTFRLNSDTVQKLEDLSKEKHVSPDVIANRAIRRAVDWEPRAEQLGAITTQKATLRFLWDKLSEDEAREYGRKNGGERGAELLLFWFKTFTFEAFVEAMRMFGAEYGGVYQFQYDYINREHSIMMRHELGKNFTAYMAEACSETLKLLVADFKIAESENQLSITVIR